MSRRRAQLPPGWKRLHRNGWRICTAITRDSSMCGLPARWINLRKDKAACADHRPRVRKP